MNLKKVQNVSVLGSCQGLVLSYNKKMERSLFLASRSIYCCCFQMWYCQDFHDFPYIPYGQWLLTVLSTISLYQSFTQLYTWCVSVVHTLQHISGTPVPVHSQEYSVLPLIRWNTLLMSRFLRLQNLAVASFHSCGLFRKSQYGVKLRGGIKIVGIFRPMS